MDLKVVSKCTYEGCQLNFNEEEKVWICPCCGSRFSAEGKVLQGPATKDLANL